MHLYRGNSYTNIRGAPSWFLQYLSTLLSIPVESGIEPGARFGRVYFAREQWWGSLLVGDRVPAGLTERVISIARYYTQQGYPVPVEVHDHRLRPEDNIPWHSVRAPWRPYQDAVHAAILASGCGVIDAPPRSGKTLMAARAVDALAQPTVYLAPSVAIVHQTYEVFVRLFGEHLVARLDGTEKGDLGKEIVIATVQSAVKQPEEWWNTRAMLIIDEFHHAAADTYYQINDLAQHVYHRLCFTGTHWRTGEDGLALEGICSNVLQRVTVEHLVTGGYLARPFVAFVPFHAPAFAAQNWQEAYDAGIVNHEARNAAVVQYAEQLVDQGHSVLVIVNRRAHADALGARIKDARVAKGGEGALTSRAIREFAERRYPVLVGTSVLGEGVDVPNASALIYAGGFGDSVQLMQSYFRPLTSAAGKQAGCVYDFLDLHHPTLQRHAEDRLRLARKYLGPWLHQ